MKTELRKQAIKLRRRGYSIKQIKRKLGVSQNSASRWCRGIELTPEQQAKLQERERVVSTVVGKRNKAKWDKRKQIVAEQYHPPITDPAFMLGLGIYWGEGFKTGTYIGVSNSDPNLVRTLMTWLRTFFEEDIDNFSITCRHYYKRRDAEIIAYWKSQLELTTERILPSTFHVSTAGKNRRGRTLPYGCVSVSVRGQPWRIRTKLNVAMAAISDVHHADQGCSVPLAHRHDP